MVRVKNNETTPLTGGRSNVRPVSNSTAKCSVFIFFLICFTGMIILAAILKSYIEEWSSLTNANLRVVTSLVIAAGVIGSFLSLNVWAREADQKFLIIVYTFAIILQIAAIMYGCIQVADKNHVLKKTIEADMKKHFFNYSGNIKDTFDELQMQKLCCGVFSADDYAESDRKIPFSCCEISENMNQYCTNESLVYQDGCAPKIYDDIIYNVGVLSYTTIGLVILQIIFGVCGISIIIQET